MSLARFPLIVLVPGAFATPACFDKLVAHLGEFQTYPAAYPSCNPADPFNATCMSDITAMRRILLSLLDQKRDVVILAHSYGGIVAGSAAKGLDQDTRSAQGYSNAVVGLIYVSGNISLEGESLLEASGGGGAPPPFVKADTPSEGLAVIAPAMDILYNDLDPGLEPELSKLMNPHALQAFSTKPSAPAWQDKGFDRRRIYVRTLQDRVHSTFLQDKWIAKSGVEWDVVDFGTGHMPFVSQPEALAAQVAKSVRKLAEL
ncbi:Alpha/Beta hydrolase protein [Xylaria intraflava]|nr:Alpha/Beta hydrolase protein [Xylaria intraflava]